jgi:hypothetical protein
MRRPISTVIVDESSAALRTVLEIRGARADPMDAAPTSFTLSG